MTAAIRYSFQYIHMHISIGILCKIHYYNLQSNLCVFGHVNYLISRWKLWPRQTGRHYIECTFEYLKFLYTSTQMPFQHSLAVSADCRCRCLSRVIYWPHVVLSWSFHVGICKRSAGPFVIDNSPWHCQLELMLIGLIYNWFMLQYTNSVIFADICIAATNYLYDLVIDDKWFALLCFT